MCAFWQHLFRIYQKPRTSTLYCKILLWNPMQISPIQATRHLECFLLHRAVMPFLSRGFPTLQRCDNLCFLQLLKEMTRSPFGENQDDRAIFHVLWDIDKYLAKNHMLTVGQKSGAANDCNWLNVCIDNHHCTYWQFYRTRI